MNQPLPPGAKQKTMQEYLQALRASLRIKALTVAIRNEFTARTLRYNQR